MRRFWTIVNLALIASAVYGGYKNVQPRNHLNANFDWTFVSMTFLLTAIFPWGAMIYSRSIGVTHWRRPSLDRNPLRWSIDPLQPRPHGDIASF
jgi:hypothetical protein